MIFALRQRWIRAVQGERFQGAGAIGGCHKIERPDGQITFRGITYLADVFMDW